MTNQLKPRPAFVKKKEFKQLPPPDEIFYQAVGLMKGCVIYEQYEQIDKKYRKFYLVTNGVKFKLNVTPKTIGVALKHSTNKCCEANEVFILVYPKLDFAPPNQRKEPPVLSFRLVAIAREKNQFQQSNLLTPNHFYLRGIYQRLPQYKGEVVTVYRNRISYKAQQERIKQGDLMGACHCPIKRLEGNIAPFRFSPKAEAQAPKPYVNMLAKLVVTQKACNSYFELVEFLSGVVFCDKSPPYTKLSDIERKQIIKQKQKSTNNKRDRV